MIDDSSATRSIYPASASHHTVQIELSERVQFNDESVLRRLHYHSVDRSFVLHCEKALREACAREIKALKTLASIADGMSIDVLESEATREHSQGDARNAPRSAVRKAPVGESDKKSHREVAMIEPLAAILDYIRDFNDESQGKRPMFQRRFVRQSDTLLPDEYHTLAFPRFMPDFTLLRNESRGSRRWSDRDGFIEVKPSAQQHPYPTSEGDPAKPILTQVANYARLHLSARPFSVFSVSLMIFGNDFCVCIFDRGGGQVSPRYNMWRDIGTFIRVVRSMTRLLSEEQLGRDPSVTQVDETMHPTSRLEKGSFVVNPVGSDKRRWCTIGDPLWSSLSLFGRGTTVCHVREIDDNNELRGPRMILKSSWRSSERDPESTIYEAIVGDHPGVAQYVVGADVVFPPGSERTITVHSIRGVSLQPGESTTILHRVILGSVGKPIWEWDSEEQLIAGLLAAVRAHKFLYDQGILHRDISAGNVLLATQPDGPGAEGFLTDIEFARTKPVLPVSKSESVSPDLAYGPVPEALSKPMTRVRTKFIDTLRGATITGTLQFMSRRLLNAVIKGEKAVATAEDDVESFYWVLFYAILRKLVMTRTGHPDERSQASEVFQEMFGGTDAKMIYRARTGDGYIRLASVTDLLEKSLSYPLRGTILYIHAYTVMQGIQIVGKKWQDPNREDLLKDFSAPQGVFSHENFIKRLESTLDKLRRAESRPAGSEN